MDGNMSKHTPKGVFEEIQIQCYAFVSEFYEGNIFVKLSVINHLIIVASLLVPLSGEGHL